MLLGYNTNGLAHHDPLSAINLLADIGYRSVALTIDHHLLNPFNPRWPDQLQAISAALSQRNLRSVIETGARFLLDPRVKHEPTLVSASVDDRHRRIAFLKHAVDVASALGSDCVSLWSGVVRDGASQDVVMDRLLSGLAELLNYMDSKLTSSLKPPASGLFLGFEPEPDMAIDTMERYQTLLDKIDSERFRLTLDVGHLHCQRETPLADMIRRFGSRLVNVHIEDMQAGVHEHLMFGEGEIDFPPVIQALHEVGYRGGIHVELSRHSHVGPAAARSAYEFLSPLIDHCTQRND